MLISNKKSLEKNKQKNPTIDMAKTAIKSEKLTPFGGIFSIMEQFDALLAQTILLDKVRGFCVCNVSVMQGICTIK